MKANSPFDPEALRCSRSLLAAELSKAEQRRREHLKTSWAQIPQHRGLELAKRIGDPVLAVLLVLEQAIYEARSNRVKLTNGLLKQYGFTRQAKTRGLRKLAAADVIAVEWKGKEAPFVTHLWYTKHGKLRAA